VKAHIDSLVKRASRCQVDSDCAHIETSTSCEGTCGAWVNERYGRRVLRLIERLDQGVCQSPEYEGCPVPTPLCIQERGVCRANHCVGVPANTAVTPVDPATDLSTER
jgi:hypothetical protein